MLFNMSVSVSDVTRVRLHQSSCSSIASGQAALFLQCLTLTCLQLSTKDKEEELLKMQEKYGVDAEQHPQKRK